MVEYFSSIEQLKSSAEVAILCGGEGKRLGNIDKASILFNDERLVDRISRVAKQLGSPLSWVEKTAGHLSDPHQYADRRLEDDPLGGSVGALVTALNSSSKEWVWILACDLPFIEVRHLAILAEQVMKVDQDVACITFVDSQHLHPLCALWRSNQANSLKKMIKNRGKISDFIKCYGALVSAASLIENEKISTPKTPLFNLNYPEDLKLLYTP